VHSIKVSRKFKRNYVAAFVSLVLFASGVLSGILFQKYYSVGQLLKTIGVRDKTLANSPVQRAEAPISSVPSGRVMVALVFGQSNSANFGETPHKSRQGVYNFYKGKLYPAQDPLLGATGDGGSVWTRLGDQLVEKKYYDAIVFVPLGVGETAIARWKSDGDLHPAILQAIHDVEAQGLTITHLLWHQGESDALLKTSQSTYKIMFLDMLLSIRKQGVNAPIYVSVATRCQKQLPDEQIRQAQQELVNPALGIYGGPDTDKLGFGDRYDGCHFSAEGLEKFAQLWLEKLDSK
jgi:hypothetical protein